MRATAIAQPNIALVKYWGKADILRNLPAVGSLSITLDALTTTMTVDLQGAGRADELILNGQINHKIMPRVSACLDRLLGKNRGPAAIRSECNFPIAAGLASSAAAFAALVVATNAAADLSLDKLSLARAAGAASGSAARSLYGGFVELSVTPEDIAVESVVEENAWPLDVIVAVNAHGPKAMSSGEAMQLSAQTSPFYDRWVKSQDVDLAAARTAVLERDFSKLAEVSEHSCLKMHSVMWGSRPPVVYWNAATIACMESVRQMQCDGLDVFFTVDAGPQVKVICLPEIADEVHSIVRGTDGVLSTMRTALGQGARVVGDG